MNGERKRDYRTRNASANKKKSYAYLKKKRSSLPLQKMAVLPLAWLGSARRTSDGSSPSPRALYAREGVCVCVCDVRAPSARSTAWAEASTRPKEGGEKSRETRRGQRTASRTLRAKQGPRRRIRNPHSSLEAAARWRQRRCRRGKRLPVPSGPPFPKRTVPGSERRCGC